MYRTLTVLMKWLLGRFVCSVVRREPARALVIARGGLEQLDEVARRIPKEDLARTDTGGDVVDEGDAVGPQMRDGRVEVRDTQRHPVPAARLRLRPVGKRVAVPGDAEQEA